MAGSVRLALLLCLVLTPVGATAEIYRYQDDAGRIHFVDSPDKVPARYKSQLSEISGDLDGRRINVIDGMDRSPASRRSESPSGGVTSPSMQMPAGTQDLPGVNDLFGGAAPTGGLLVGFLLGALLVLVGMLFGMAFLLRRVSGWFDVEPPGWGKAIGILIVQGIVGGLVNVGMACAAGGAMAAPSVSFQAGSAVLGLLASAAVLRGMLTDSFVRALGIAVVMTLVLFVIGLVVGIAIPLLLALSVA